MKSNSLLVRLGFVGLGYASVSTIAAILLYVRHLQALRYPAEASGGMWAAGDAFLYLFLAFLFMIPTAFLIWVLAKFEGVYKTYSQFLLGLSLSAPVSLSVLYLGTGHLAEGLNNLVFCRLVLSPLVLVGMGLSRLVARFDLAKKLVTYALLIEGSTLGVAVALLIRAARAGGH